MSNEVVVFAGNRWTLEEAIEKRTELDRLIDHARRASQQPLHLSKRVTLTRKAFENIFRQKYGFDENAFVRNTNSLFSILVKMSVPHHMFTRAFTAFHIDPNCGEMLHNMCRITAAPHECYNRSLTYEIEVASLIDNRDKFRRGRYNIGEKTMENFQLLLEHLPTKDRK